MRKKFFIVFLALLLVITSIISPVKRTEAAFAPAIPAASGAVIGMYVTGALAVAGLATLAGLEYGEDIAEHARSVQEKSREVWESASQSVKDAVYNAYLSAVSAGSTVLELPQEFIDWYQNVAVKEIAESYPVSVVAPPEVYESYGVSEVYLGSERMRVRDLDGYNDWSFQVRQLGNRELYAFKEPIIFDGVEYLYTVMFNSRIALFSNENAMISRVGYRLEFETDPLSVDLTDLVDLAILNGVPLVLSSAGAVVGRDTPPVVDKYAEQVGKSVERIFERSKKLGLPLVVGGIIGTLASGASVLYDPTTDRIINEDGSVFEGNPDDITWGTGDLVVERNADGTIATDAEGNAEVRPEKGDDNVITGNQVAAGTAGILGLLSAIWNWLKGLMGKLSDLLSGLLETLMSFLSGLISSLLDGIGALVGSITDLLSSILSWLVGSLSSLIGSIIDILSSILSWLGGLVSSIATTLQNLFIPSEAHPINWNKFRVSLSGLTTAFPFSLPWDIARAFDAVFGTMSTGKIPEWEYPINLLGEQKILTITIPEFFHPWFPVIRNIVLIIFDVSIIYALRKWFGGAT